ncbi:MAG: hypothetical protein PHR68_04935 [Candidatus Gracilibacteria bacterium]|nr:hypothetical protein [Candidatus Gracilibacteria bacterium]
MKKTKKAETLVSILIGVFILSLISIGAIKIMEYDKQKTIEYDKINKIFLLEANSNNLIKKIPTSQFGEKQVFYLYKTGSQILAYSGISNDYIKYIDEDGNTINTGTYKGYIYTRLFIIDKDTSTSQLVKGAIKELIRK